MSHVAIIDIGSNAVRLVIYDGLTRAPVRLHTERAICNLGADLAATGALNPSAAAHALETLQRFAGLAAAMGLTQVRAVATAALRDASDGRAFIERVRGACGLEIDLLDGEEEARLSALGVLGGGVGGDCVIGDYGGGSLELIVVRGGEVRHKHSFPLGSHRLLAEKTREARVKTIETLLAQAEFLKDCEGLDFYAMGGAWRTMAKAHMRLREHPLQLLDHYCLEGRKAAAFARYVAGRNHGRIEKLSGLSGKRLGDMAVSALTMEILFRKIRPARLFFSGTGLREGLLFEQLDAAALKEDALIAGAARIGAKTGRFGDAAPLEALHRWLAPIFAGEGAEVARLLHAGCLLSDIAWLDPEDEQAEQAFRRVAVLPLYGIDHPGRAFLALSQYVRHRGRLDGDLTAPLRQLLDNRRTAQAVAVGLAQRLAYMLTGGTLELLEQIKLEATTRKLVLLLEGPVAALNAAPVEEAMERLADVLKKDAVVVVN